MSRSDDRPQIGAWGKIKLGWIPPGRILELLPGQQGAIATIDPLEIKTSGIQSIIVYLNATTYFLIENRQPIGFDKVLPDKGVLVSYVDEAKCWRGDGPVVVQDASPETGPRWQLLHPTLDIAPGKRDRLANQTYDLAIGLLGKQGDSYKITVGNPSFVDTSYPPQQNQLEPMIIIAVSPVLAALVILGIYVAHRRKARATLG